MIKHLFVLNQSLMTRLLCVMALSLGLVMAKPAHAIPAFARQTSLACSACHVGSFGPQLTSMGRTFKLNGYTMGDAKLWQSFSAMAVGGNDTTAKDQAPNPPFKANNNTTIDQVSLFYGGKILDNLGTLAQLTYNANDKTIALDNTDIRYAKTTKVWGQDVLLGVTVNNNPSVQDVWQTTPAWGYPFISSASAPTAQANIYMSSQAGQVVGVGGYSLWNNLVYAEYASYYTLGDKLQGHLGNGDVSGNDHIKGNANYWRLALQHDYGLSYVSVGAFGYISNIYPGNERDMGSDKYTDTALDATYQVTSADQKHSVSLYGVYVKENQNLMASYAIGNSANPANTLSTLKINASYYYDNSYGLTFGRFITTGTADAMLYASPNAKPDTSGYMTQFDVTPFGKMNSYWAPNCNLRLFIQYTSYDKFNGTRLNYDGNGRNASDNNTVFIGLWTAI